MKTCIRSQGTALSYATAGFRELRDRERSFCWRNCTVHALTKINPEVGLAV